MTYVKFTSFGAFEFNVNEAKRTVTAILRADPKSGYACGVDELNKASASKVLFTNATFTQSKKDVIKFIGVAKCAPEDEFDAVFGADLAELRAYKQYLRARKQRLAEMKQFFLDAANRVQDRIDRTENAIKGAEEEIEDFSKNM